MSAADPTKTCAEIAPLLVFYVCDEVSSQERAAIDAHLAACEDCRVQLAEESAFQEAVGAIPQAAESLDSASVLLAQCRSELEFTPALRQQHARAVQALRCLRDRSNRLLESAFLRELHPAVLASRQMRINGRALLRAHFIANVEHQQRCNLSASFRRISGAHRSSPSSLRNLRVARNSEFFTVSSLVPRAAPMARSLSPW